MLLLTAFEPFDGTGVNSSQLALRLFLERHPLEIGGVPVASTILPVSYGADVRALEAARALLPAAPRAILHLGQTGDGEVAVEQRAVNLRLPDDSRDWGTWDEHVPISDGAPEFLASTFPAAQIVAALSQSGVPCCASQDAGTYLCNHILFRSLERAEDEGSPASIGFLHLPRLPEQVGSSESEQGDAACALPIETLARAVEVTARTIAKYL